LEADRETARNIGRSYLRWRAALIGVGLGCVVAVGADARTPDATWSQPGPAPDNATAHIPVALLHPQLSDAYPDAEVAARIWRAVDSFVATHPPQEIYPGYAAEAGGPSRTGAATNVESSCHDFPDLPDPFGAGAHHRACYSWVAGYLGLYHGARGRAFDSSDDWEWASHYLDEALDHLALMVYGPDESPSGEGHRDTLAAIWQNPHRAVYVALIADLLRGQGRLEADVRLRTEELLSGVVRAWHAEWWQSGVHPSSGTTLTSRTAPDVTAYSLEGRQVVSREPWEFRWDGDKGNTPAEEAAWMGAGIMLSSQVLSGRLEPGEVETLSDAGRHYVDYAVALERPDEVHGGTVSTLNRETEGGACGQRRYWLENHTPDAPSIPYVGWTWLYIDAALLGSPLGDQKPWLSLVPDEAQWQVLVASAEESFHAADGSFLIDWREGGGLGFDLTACSAWGMPCGEWSFGKHYVRYSASDTERELYVSEIGHPGGLDLVATAWPLMRLAAARGDRNVYRTWRGRLERALAEYERNPPDPLWAECKVAPYVSDNPGYHWARMLEMYVIAALGASGYEVRPWER
jgi:hypothetical protein